MKSLSTGPQKVGHEEHKRWMHNNDFVKSSVVTSSDLETEFEILQIQEEKLFSKFTARWSIRAPVVLELTFEILN